MELNEGAEYTVYRNGENLGPFAADQLPGMVESGEIGDGDYLWSEGLDGWHPISSFDALRPIVEEVSSDPGEASGFGSAIAAVTQDHARFEETTGKRPGASFILTLVTYLVGLIGLIAVFRILTVAIGKTIESQNLTRLEDKAFTRISIENPDLFFGATAVFLLGLGLNLFFSLKYLHRAWKYIQDLPHPATTPRKAIRLLFIPVINLFWMFRAFYHWSRDYNMRCDLVDPTHAPRASETLFLVHCFLCLFGLPILHIFVMFQVCRGVNYLAPQPVLHLDPNSGYRS